MPSIEKESARCHRREGEIAAGVPSQPNDRGAAHRSKPATQVARRQPQSRQPNGMKSDALMTFLHTRPVCGQARPSTVNWCLLGSRKLRLTAVSHRADIPPPHRHDLFPQCVYSLAPTELMREFSSLLSRADQSVSKSVISRSHPALTPPPALNPAPPLPF